MDFIPMIPLNETEIDKWNTIQLEGDLPAIALRNSVLFPGIVYPITVNRAKSVNAFLEAQKQENKYVVALVQKDSSVENPMPEDIETMGTLVQIVRLINMPDNSITAIVQAIRKLKVKNVGDQEKNCLTASVTLIKEPEVPKTKKFKAMISGMKELMDVVIKNSVNMPEELSIVLKNINHGRFLISFIATNLVLSNSEKLEILSLDTLEAQGDKVMELLKREVHFGELKKKLTTKTHTEIEKQQKEYFLHQQLKNIKEELGDVPNEQEINELKTRAEKKKWSKTVKAFFEKNIKKLDRMHPSAPDYSVVLGHLQLMLDLPWDEVSQSSYTLSKVQKVLNEDHYGMEYIKSRIVEYMAVLSLKKNLKSPILCLAGPPGIGKTSLAKSVARAVGREYVRVSLGGVHDESEIRGHRKTYIGAMPGRIIQSIKKAGSSDAVLLLDEIDKVGSNTYTGDPSAALLEVLDPEQNFAFHDNYLEVDYDLSRVLFIATANDISTISPPLRDRMEIIQLSGYSIEEKVKIAADHLVPKQLKAHGLEKLALNWKNETIEQIIKSYTMESGVRELDRKIAAICRNKAMVYVKNNHKPPNNFNDISVNNILGTEKYIHDTYKENLPVGVVIGLAWTPFGGSILHIESVMHSGKGKLNITGNIGKVMQESAEAAITILRSQAKKWKLDTSLLENNNFHIHIPEGATPKDGPSAGVTLFCSLFSLLSNKKPKTYTAMSGEITLRGDILPVGGIKEKILAAKREGIKYIFLPIANKRDVSEIKSSFIKGLKIYYIKDVNELVKKTFYT